MNIILKEICWLPVEEAGTMLYYANIKKYLVGWYHHVSALRTENNTGKSNS